MPVERRAMAMRMKNMAPKLINANTFEVIANNSQVSQYLHNIKDHILSNMREALHNSQIQMSIRIAEVQEVQYITSKPAMFKVMCEKNHNIQRLADELNLEII